MKGMDARLDAVEVIREWQVSQSHYRRTALVVAALFGMAAGFLLSCMMPCILTWLNESCAGMPVLVRGRLPVAAWAVAGLLSVIVATNAYALAMALGKSVKMAARPH